MQRTSDMPGRLGWEAFESRGRPYWRIQLDGPETRRGTFIICQRLVDRFEVQALFAAGPTSVLLGATDQLTGHPVLIKTIRTDVLLAQGFPPELLRDELRAARHLLQTERRLLVRLRNRRCGTVPAPIAYVHDRNPLLENVPGVDEPLVASEPYLVLEQVAARSLEELIEAEFPEGMPEDLALLLIEPVIDTLALLQEPWTWQSGRTWHIVYQDLKPANMLVDRLGRPILIDFGGCQVVVDRTPVLEGSFTPGYAPPECFGPGRVLLGCADVYTAGSTLYHMLTGIDPRDLFQRNGGRISNYFDVRALRSRCSEPLSAVVERCLAVQPSDRFADARQVGEALRKNRNLAAIS